MSDPADLGNDVEWAVTLVIAAPATRSMAEVPAFADRAFDALARDNVADAVVGSDDWDISLRFTVRSGAPDEALAEGVHVWRRCAELAGLPDWPLVLAEVATYDQRDEAFRSLALPTLVGVAEVAQMLGVTKQRVSALHRDERLPQPITRLASGPVWSAAGIQTFARTRSDRRGDPRPER